MSDAATLTSSDTRFPQTMDAIFDQAIKLNVPVTFGVEDKQEMVVMTRAQFDEIRATSSYPT